MPRSKRSGAGRSDDEERLLLTKTEIRDTYVLLIGILFPLGGRRAGARDHGCLKNLPTTTRRESSRGKENFLLESTITH
jgi:hypothetical protein